MKVAIYTRMSNPKRRDPRSGIVYGEDTAAQLQVLRAFIRSRDWTLYREFRETTSGGPKGEPLAFNEMMRDARRRDFDVLLFWSWDRITRRGVGPIIAIMNQFKAAGIAWLSHEEQWLSTQTDPNLQEFLLAFLGFMARYERERQSRRTKAWHQMRSNLGLPHGRQKGSKDRKPRTRRWHRRPASLSETDV